ncbi:MAG: murein L,D-transpeptidase family protein [Bacteroidia bacterium]
MKTPATLFFFFFLTTAFAQSNHFLSDQKKFVRVKTAYHSKEPLLKKTLKSFNLGFENFTILITAFKFEKEMDIYVKNKNETVYKKLATYKICALSGELGPKRKQGDNQVPEGFYCIDRFNPSSSYYLSLRLNYPNQSDKIKSKATDLGGDIFIHGKCVTIGCMPMTNDKIEEIYLYALQARANGQMQIPVYVFPFRMTTENVLKFNSIYKTNSELLNFWKNLMIGYDRFMKDLRELKISVDKKGDYIF